MRIYSKMEQIAGKKHKSKNLVNLTKGKFAKTLHFCTKLSARSSLFFIVSAIPAAPIILLYGSYKFSGAIFSKIQSKFLASPLAKVEKKLSHILATVTSNPFVTAFYTEMKEYELSKLTKVINAKTDVDVWFIPSGFWPQAEGITAKKVIAIPDVVFSEFPALFRKEGGKHRQSLAQIEKSVKIDAHFICYSEHVKFEHLVKPFHLNPNQVSILKHGATDLSPFLRILEGTLTGSAHQIIHEFQKESLKDHPYLCDFHFPSMKFLFYSSQIRPHKNVLALIKAYEQILRHRFINIKLILTGHPPDFSPVNEYLLSRGLERDVLSLFNIPDRVLAALNHLAVCAVNPTLFEGGFPFTFCEAYSVGTPSIMSRIPVVLEESKDEALNQVMLFDPYNLEDMTDKIAWAIHHREELFALQKPLYEHLSQRTCNDATRAHLDLFDRISRGSNDVEPERELVEKR